MPPLLSRTTTESEASWMSRPPREHSPCQVRAGCVFALTRGLSTGPFLRRTGVVLSCMARLSGCGDCVHSFRPMDVLASAHPARPSNFDLSKSDCFVYIRTLVYLFSLGRNHEY